jgi:hypothetical protein
LRKNGLRYEQDWTVGFVKLSKHTNEDFDCGKEDKYKVSSPPANVSSNLICVTMYADAMRASLVCSVCFCLQV